MGLPIAALSNIGIGTCTCHSGPISQSGSIVQGSPTVFAGGRPVARIGDIILAGCGHTGTIVTGAATVNANSISVAVLTSQFVGCFSGQIIDGIPNVNAS